MVEARDLILAAVATLPSAVVSHESAAEVHRFPFVERGKAVVSVHSRSTHSFPGVTVHRNHDLAAVHVVEIEGLPMTTVARTVIDLGLVFSENHLRRIVDDLIAQESVTVGDLGTTLDQVAKRGKPGSTALRNILAERGNGVDANASRLELRGLRVLREGGLPEPSFEHPIPWDRGKRFDAAYPEQQVAIEWDSRRWHGLIDSFERDRRRDRAALLHGWIVLRFTWKDVTDQPAEVVATVRAILQERSVDAGGNRGL